MNASLILNFIELIKIITSSESQEHYMEKAKEIQLILINFHHLLNEFRPHQARDVIKYLLQEQLKLRRNALDKVRQTVQKIQNSNSK